MAQRFAIAFGKCDYFCFQISVTTDFSRKVIRSKFCKSIRLWNNIQWISWCYKSNHTLNSLVVVNQHSLLFRCIPIAAECMCGKLGAICVSKEFSQCRCLDSNNHISILGKELQWTASASFAVCPHNGVCGQVHNIFRPHWAETLENVVWFLDSKSYKSFISTFRLLP